MRTLHKHSLRAGAALRHSWHFPARYWQQSRWHKIIVLLAALVILAVGTMYAIAQWYIHSEQSKPYVMGVSFIPDYASSLGVEPQETMDALINDLHIKAFRLTSYWSDIETSPGHYDFSQLDWEFAKAERAHATVTLSVGLRQPRWPECHAPSFYDTSQPETQWQPQLSTFMATVINRYKNSPALKSWQLENEYFLKGFGECKNFSRQRLISEYNLLHNLDRKHPIIINRSNNALGWPIGQPQGDLFGISIYKRTWNDPISDISQEYLEYPFPAWYYGFVAGWTKIFTGKDTIIHELQAEPYSPHGQTIPQTSLYEQSRSFDAKRFEDRFRYAKGTGMREVYFWGAEYWYYRNVVLNDPSVWHVAQQEFARAPR